MRVQTASAPSSTELLAVAISIVLAASALLLLSPGASIADDKNSEASMYLGRIASSQLATYQARELVVYFGKPQSAALVDVYSSNGAQFVRAEAGTTITRLWRRADRGIVSASRGAIEDASPPDVVVSPADVLAKYAVDVGAPEKMLGVTVVPLSFQRRRDDATVERIWVHPASGIVYRRELYAPSGRRIGMSTIIDMHWGEKTPTERFDRAVEVPTQAREGRVSGAPARLANGYRLLGGYHLKMAGRPADQWLYSDGLHALSVFRTHGGLRAPADFRPSKVGRLHAFRGPGPGTWAWEGGGSTWVIVAEESALDPTDMTRPFPKGGPSAWARMGSLWARAARGVRSLF
jgi:hypothetical protein